MFEYTEYELQKKRNKQELVRNEFKTVGNYQIPLIRKQEIDLDTISLISFSDTKQDDKKMLISRTMELLNNEDFCWGIFAGRGRYAKMPPGVG